MALAINTHCTGKLIQIGFFVQVKDVLPVILLSLSTGIIAYLPTYFLTESIFQLFAGEIMGALFFIGVYWVLKFSELTEVRYFLFKTNK